MNCHYGVTIAMHLHFLAFSSDNPVDSQEGLGCGNMKAYFIELRV